MANYEIRVLGGKDALGDADQCNGFAFHSRYDNFEDAETALYDLLLQFGWYDVAWNWDSAVADDFEPYEEPDDIDSDFGFDPYAGCYTYDC